MCAIERSCLRFRFNQKLYKSTTNLPTSAATFHSAFTSIIGWRLICTKYDIYYTKKNVTLLGLTSYPLNKMSNSIFKWKIIWFYLHYSYTRFVYTELRLHPLLIIRLITTLLFSEFSHISQTWNRFKLNYHNWAYD